MATSPEPWILVFWRKYIDKHHEKLADPNYCPWKLKKNLETFRTLFRFLDHWMILTDPIEVKDMQEVNLVWILLPHKYMQMIL